LPGAVWKLDGVPQRSADDPPSPDAHYLSLNEQHELHLAFANRQLAAGPPVAVIQRYRRDRAGRYRQPRAGVPGPPPLHLPLLHVVQDLAARAGPRGRPAQAGGAGPGDRPRGPAEGPPSDPRTTARWSAVVPIGPRHTA
jgi:hypothetical protein